MEVGLIGEHAVARRTIARVVRGTRRYTKTCKIESHGNVKTKNNNLEYSWLNTKFLQRQRRQRLTHANPAEWFGSGAWHESDWENFLLEHGVVVVVADACVNSLIHCSLVVRPCYYYYYYYYKYFLKTLNNARDELTARRVEDLWIHGGHEQWRRRKDGHDGRWANQWWHAEWTISVLSGTVL